MIYFGLDSRFIFPSLGVEGLQRGSSAYCLNHLFSDGVRMFPILYSFTTTVSKSLESVAVPLFAASKALKSKAAKLVSFL
jgi:hypothetical protein